MSNKSEILALGCGGCGNNQLDTLLKLDKRYTGIFFNTNMREMEELKTFDRIRRCFYIPNADGAGKDRNLTEGYLKVEAPKFAEMISKFTTQKYILQLSSGNGGTGSKAVTMLPKLVKRITPDKTISLMATMPSINETDIDFENAIDFWNEVMEQYERGLITNLMFIDNNKLSSENEINHKALKTYNDMFEVIGGKVDSSDLSRIFKQPGYNVVLKLDNAIRNTSDAIDKAIDDSVFFIPENLECEVLVATVNTNYFNVEEIKDKIPAYSFNKINKTTEGDTIIVLGGCDIPSEPIELIQEALDELREKAKTKRTSKRNLRVSPKRVEGKKEEINQPSTLSSKDLNDLFDDDDFWN
ncbi:TPA: hypothetical protein QCR73_005695 [Bacillus anthracis]|nr:hypothetical protein [Bacillus anthracis]